MYKYYVSTLATTFVTYTQSQTSIEHIADMFSSIVHMKKEVTCPDVNKRVVSFDIVNNALYCLKYVFRII